MATSLAAQLQAIASVSASASAQKEELLKKRPFTRPSILYDGRHAADIGLHTIHAAALEGLDELAKMDSRFASFKKTLFSHESLETDREIHNREYNAKLDKSIALYLRLLSQHLLLANSHDTLEYLIRRHKIYAYNVDDLILCALPYHETNIFVRIVQLLNLKNTKWHFLEGVKESGAPLPRTVLVQQCTREMAIIEAICEYSMPVVKTQSYSRTSVSFCVALMIETLGAVTIVNTDLINKILPSISRCFDPMVGQDYKVAGLMIVATLADRATMSEKLTKQLIFLVAKSIDKYVITSDGIPLFQMTLMAMIKLTQAQSINIFPWKALEILACISDLAVSLFELSKAFNCEKFLSLIVDGLIYHSFQQKSCQAALISVVEAVPLKDHIVNIVSKILVKYEKMQNDTREAGMWMKCILLKIEELYPAELDKAICNLLENSQENTRESVTSGSTIHEILQRVFHGSLHIPMEESNSSVYVSLEHPQPQIRVAAVSRLATLGILEDCDRNTMKMVNIQEALLRRLYDDDLSVVHTVLSLDSLARIIDPIPLLKALTSNLSRCFSILRTGSMASKQQAHSIGDACLEFSVSNFLVQNPYCLKEVATMMLPYILIFPKTWKLNLKALQLASRIAWPFFSHLSSAIVLAGDGQSEKLREKWWTSTNSQIVEALSDALLENLGTHLPWLIESCREFGIVKPVLFLILIHSFMQQGKGKFWHLLEGCFPFVKQEWSDIYIRETIIQTKPNNMHEFFAQTEMYKQIEAENQEINGNILIAVFWSLLKNMPRKSTEDSDVLNGGNLSVLEDLFVLFSMSSSKEICREHINVLVIHKKVSVVPFLSKFFMAEGSAIPVAVQVESLSALSFLFSAYSSEWNGIQSIDFLRLQLALPCLLVALCSAVQAVRRAATKCLQSLHVLWCRLTISSQEYGTEAMDERYLSMEAFEKFLESIVQLKNLFDSDGNFLGPFLSSVLNSSAGNISGQDNLHKRFDENTKEAILLFILRNAFEFPTYAKWTILSMLQGAGHISRQVAETKDLLSNLISRRKGFHLKFDLSTEKLSYDDIQLLYVVLKTYMLDITSSANLGKQLSRDSLAPVFEALFVDGLCQDDPACTKPCILVLENLSSTFYDSQDITVQDQIFQHLIILINSDFGAIRNAAFDALQRFNVDGTTVAKHLDLVLEHVDVVRNSPKKLKKHRLESQTVLKQGKHLSFVSAMLDFLVWRKDFKNRVAVIEPLFKLLDKIIKREELLGGKQHERRSPDMSYLQQIILTVLETISNLLLMESYSKVDICTKFNVHLVVECVNVAKDSTTRNHALSLLTTLAKLLPDQVLGHVINIFSVMGESTKIKEDSHSQKVSKELISAVVPCWIRTNNDPKWLLEVFINGLPQMSQHCKLTITKHLLGVLGEETSLPVLLLLLLQGMVSTMGSLGSCIKAQDKGVMATHLRWQYEFAVQLSMQYPPKIWLLSLVNILECARLDACVTNKGALQSTARESYLWELQIEATQLVADYLKSSELSFELETGHNRADVQEGLGALMEQVVLQLQLLEKKAKQLIVPSGFKKDAREAAYSLLNAVTKLMDPGAYSKGITSLLRNSDADVCQKALHLLCQKLRSDVALAQQPKKKKLLNFSSAPWNSLGQYDESCMEMILEIIEFLNRSQNDSSVAAKIAAVSTLDALTKRFTGNFPAVFMACLKSVVANLKVNDILLSSECLCCIATLVSELGPQALAELPHIVRYLLKKAWQVCSSSKEEGMVSKDRIEARATFLISVLCALDAIVNNLGSFLNPYLEEIIGLLVLHLEVTGVSNLAVVTKAAVIRTLIAEKISVRLLLDPLLKVYEKGVNTSEASVAAIFDILAAVVSKMDRQSVSTYHAKIFTSCLVALDLRRHHPNSIKDVFKVESSIINALVALTLKLSEATFKPLFIRALDWAESNVESDGSFAGRSLRRNISFYALVESLTGKLRSVFVPYYQYLIDGCVYHLSGGQHQEADVQLHHKNKKAKLVVKSSDSGLKEALTMTEWHLRKLVISSLHKCFLYDTVGFLDSSKFQVLLKPIVSQLVVDPPKLLKEWEQVPSVEEVDDLLVSCLGQMALTAGTDLLWKPLNHEVLMQTRSDKLRARVLGLRVVKYLVEHLKEEYLILIPETIPFLGELLEDSELQVVAKAQEILKSMEDMSGESLSQYL